MYDLLDVEKKKVISKTSFSAETHSEVTSPKPSDTSIPADGENVKPKFSLKVPVEETKNLLALHNLTEKNLLGRQRTPNFNPRPPRGGRLERVRDLLYQLKISIHAPREGGDELRVPKAVSFYISIHAPREGGDVSSRERLASRSYFNPRPPRGGRPYGCVSLAYPTPIFQSTPPARGAT